MTLRHYIICLTCGTRHTLRIGVGHGDRQEHSILCTNCGEAMLICVNLDQTQGSWDIEHVENCNPSETGGIIVNLHPEFLVPAELVHKDYISINILASQHNFKKINDNAEKWELLTHEERQRATELSKSTLVLEGEWANLKRCWSQLIKGNISVAQKIADTHNGKYPDMGSTPQEWIFSFALRAISPLQRHLFDDIMNVVSTIHKNNSLDFISFIKHHKSALCLQHMKKYYKIFEDFFACYSDFSQHFMAKKIFPGQGPGTVSSCKFSKTLHFYGDCFESLGSGFATLACLSNLNKNRKFDEFSTSGFTLSNYISSDKSGRTKCFADIKEFAVLASDYDSAIRNGSHHGTFDLDPKTRTISFRPRKSDKVESMPYEEYIEKCVSLFISIAAMTAVELILWNTRSK